LESSRVREFGNTLQSKERQARMAEVQKIHHMGNVHFGADPEVFFEKDGRIIGAEKILPATGELKATPHSPSKWVLDGVQVELNPANSHCRALLANTFKAQFILLKQLLAEKGKGLSINWSPVVELEKMELDSLSDKCKVAGCMPSINFWSKKPRPMVDFATYLKRSAAGHIHLGIRGTPIFDQRERLVPLLDAFVGNTCVLLDTNPLNRVRRRYYGRAGEYRLPNHGLEYRTLSNFWLRAYPMMSMVFGLARMAIDTLYTSLMPEPTKFSKEYQAVYYPYGGYKPSPSPWPAEKELLSSLDSRNLVRAINRNDIDLAWQNWEVVKKFIAAHFHPSNYEIQNGGPALWGDVLAKFEHFARTVQKSGLEHYFKDDPIKHWSTLAEGHTGGWEDFIQSQPVK
jgi:hypothetical protein